MRRAGLVAIGGVVLLGGLLQRAPGFCPLPLRSSMPGAARVPVPQPAPAAARVDSDLSDRVALAVHDSRNGDTTTRIRALEVLVDVAGPVGEAIIERATRDRDPAVAKRARELRGRRSHGR